MKKFASILLAALMALSLAACNSADKTPGGSGDEESAAPTAPVSNGGQEGEGGTAAGIPAPGGSQDGTGSGQNETGGQEGTGSGQNETGGQQETGGQGGGTATGAPVAGATSFEQLKAVYNHLNGNGELSYAQAREQLGCDGKPYQDGSWWDATRHTYEWVSGEEFLLLTFKVSAGGEEDSVIIWNYSSGLSD